jgi:phosphatidylserine/phosphatidylglycerophosphate/cardiolipin synthase-like enzyme
MTRRTMAALAVAVLAALAFPAAATPPSPPKEFPGTGTVELAFTPGDPVDAKLVAEIAAAEREILVLAFALTQPKLSRALAAARERGVVVEIVADRAQARDVAQSAVPALAREGVAVWLDGNFANAHNKVLVIDADLPRATTITGSYNFTIAAQARNAENIVIFRGNPDIAHAYRRYFRRLQARGQRWTDDEPPALVRPQRKR